MSDIRATPFHARAAGSNSGNRWARRNGFTLAEDYGDAQAEALAARTNVGIADISWRWRVFLNGSRSPELLSRLATRNGSILLPGESLKALWLNDGGAVRGAGLFARYANDQFLLISADTDNSWISEAARPFGVSLQDMTERTGGLALIGPYAEAVLDAAGLEVNLASLAFQKLFWRGLDVTISRWGEQGGYEIWCKADDCLVLWDRLMRSGARFGIRPVGTAAADILDIETGIPRPARDYMPAKDGFNFVPTPASLGLESLIDEQHVAFNGRARWLAHRVAETRALVGIEIDTEIPVPFATMMCGGKVSGHTLTSVRSPFLRRAIALAQVDQALATPDANFSLALPLSVDRTEHKFVAARIVKLPFVTPPDSLAP